ncbi:hypothetical protein J6590_105050 [Homalodisca vitripennis]|nr:hypothetical protein J6590_105050 [Homalodisca vitripennis]
MEASTPPLSSTIRKSVGNEWQQQQPVEFGRYDTMAAQVCPPISLLTNMPSSSEYLPDLPRNKIQQ